MDYEDSYSAAAGGFFVFVGPATVVGERFAVEEFLVVRGRLVDDDEGNFAVEVDVFSVGAGVVVPFVLGRVDTVSDKDDGSVEVGGGLTGLVLGDDLRAVRKIDILAAGWDEGELCFFLDGVDGDERDLLEEGVVFAGGLKAFESELSGDVFCGELVAAGTGAAPFHEIEREEADVGADLFGVDRGCCGTGGGRKAGDCRHAICICGGGLRDCGGRCGECGGEKAGDFQMVHGILMYIHWHSIIFPHAPSPPVRSGDSCSHA